jgi:hypothetical protein
MKLRPVSLECPIETKIAWARDCWLSLKGTLLEDVAVARLSGEVKEAIRESHAAMAHLGIAKECKDCEQARGGSCCGLGLENYYSGTLLLINLLLGVDVPTERVDKRSCFFLGNDGCRLSARHVICINYLCEEVSSRVSRSKIAVLRELEGVEVNLVFHLNERILKVLHRELQGKLLHS